MRTFAPYKTDVMRKTTTWLCAALLCCSRAMALEPGVDYRATVGVSTATGDFSPYFIGALSEGKHVRAGSVMADAGAWRPLDTGRRFSWGAGAEIVAGAFEADSYSRWDADASAWTSRDNRPSAAWIQQLYAEVKYRSVFLRAGQKSYRSQLLDESISSGDLTRGANARGIPGVEAGFLHFVDIPLTRGWVQIDGAVEYGRFLDDGFKEKQFNYFNGPTTKNIWYIYRRCYFRTKPSEPLSMTIGMQAAGQFGGSTYSYSQGQLVIEEHRGFRVKDVFKMLIPMEGNGNKFYEGNSLGSWDVKVRYRLGGGHELSFVFMGPWEDGSGIGRDNGTDGLWGLYYHNSGECPLLAAAGVEYLDFRNQSGPIHYAPADQYNSSLNSEATGGDNYYNNNTYGSYTNYGVAIATPFLVAPIYNLDGNPYFKHNRARGIHLGARGYIAPEWQWRLKYSWQQAWGTGRVHTTHCLVSNSALAEVGYDAARWAPGLSMQARLAFDAGSLRGNNFGVLATVSYSGNLTFSKQ